MLEPLQNPGAYWLIRDNIIEAINRHALYHSECGHFVTAVLENNLREAFARADDENIKTLFQIVSYCHNEIPGLCWGSPKLVKEWREIPKDKWKDYMVPENSKERDRQEEAGIWGFTNWMEERRGADEPGK